VGNKRGPISSGFKKFNERCITAHEFGCLASRTSLENTDEKGEKSLARYILKKPREGKISGFLTWLYKFGLNSYPAGQTLMLSQQRKENSRLDSS